MASISMWFVGSSMIKTLISCIINLPNIKRFFSPPEHTPTFLFTSSAVNNKRPRILRTNKSSCPLVRHIESQSKMVISTLKSAEVSCGQYPIVAFSDHFIRPEFALSSSTRQRKNVVLPAPFSPITANFVPASSNISPPLNKTPSSKPCSTLDNSRAKRCSFLCCLYWINGKRLDDAITSSNSIFSMRLAREVACFALEALAEKRATNAFSSPISADFLAFSLNNCSWIKDAAAMYSS